MYFKIFLPIFIFPIFSIFELSSATKNRSSDDPFPPDYLDKVINFVGSLNSKQRRQFHGINEHSEFGEAERNAKLNAFIGHLSKRKRQFGEVLLKRMHELGSVLPGKHFLSFVAEFLRLLNTLEDEQKERAEQMLAERQTDAQFEEKMVAFAKTFQKDEQKLVALKVIKEKRAIRKQLLRRLRKVHLSGDKIAEKAKQKLKAILNNTEVTHWESCLMVWEIDQMQMKVEDRDKLMYVLTLLKLKC